MRVFILIAIVLLASPASALEWEYVGLDSLQATCIEADPVHNRIFVGTISGFYYLDLASGEWTSRDEVGWIGRHVHSIAWHEELDTRVITGRENAFFKGYIELSDDMGESGDVVYSSVAGGVTGIARDVDDVNRYYACTWHDINPAEVLRSEDGGEHWMLLSGTIQYAATSIDVGPDGTIFVGGSDRVTRSLDGGDTWEPAWNGLADGYGIYCLAANPEVPGHLLASNDLGEYVTRDSGDNWVPLFPVGSSWRNIAWGWSWVIVPDASRGSVVAAVSWNGRVVLSIDGGDTWENETGTLATEVPVDLAFSPFDHNLYVVTASGGVFRALPIDPAGVNVTALGKNALAFVCPSPFRSGEELSFALRSEARTRLEVFDIMGRSVALLLDRHMPRGRHALTWETSRLGSGVFFGRLESGGAVSTLRIVIPQ
ncbi:WD40/YVTN/BNR-like repeat-containing protein [Candidatus Eisenbacteria bacterium]|uniref:WD40/YVTN/BNR-like repeat-containing protein n=1 Tax=Eiseniibacteriota bacterium TaxID=2212470 RepID=A0ABV6YLU1_UNCEI